MTNHISNPQQAYVVFTGKADLPWLRFLKAGYRHCFVLIHDGEHWVSIDPMLNHMEVQVHNVPSDFNLPGWLKDRGHRVVRTQVCRAHNRPAPFAPFTCVEAVKRILGLHNWRILTPWLLYRALTAPMQPVRVPSAPTFMKGALSWEA